METGPVCVEKITLLAEYDTATREYLDRVHELRERTPTVPRSEYELLRSSVDRAHARSELARARLNEHISRHGC